MTQTAGGPGGGGPAGLAGRGVASSATAAADPGSPGRSGEGPVGLADGDPESQRLFEAGVAGAAGVDRTQKGPKPIIDDRGPGGARPPDGSDSAASDDAGSGAAKGAGSTVRAPGPVDWGPAPTGPATPEDAWKWVGVPPGRGLIGKVEPGKMRYYMGDDGHGPVITWLPPAWPPGYQGHDG